MKLLISKHENRISPVFDAGKQFVVVDPDVKGVGSRKELSIERSDSIERVREIVELGVHVLICGAISWPLELMLVSAGMRVIPNTCGLVEDVVDAFMAGDLEGQDFLMPGCTGQRRRQRHRHFRLEEQRNGIGFRHRKK
jgi:predicted Fe-Mo cluster-binding NifX family protein